MKQLFIVVVAIAAAIGGVMLFSHGSIEAGESLGKHAADSSGEVQKVREAKRTEVIRLSPQYRATIDAKLSDFMLEWESLETQIAQNSGDPDVLSAFRSQQAGILRQMKAEVAKVGEDNVQPGVLTFLGDK